MCQVEYICATMSSNTAPTTTLTPGADARSGAPRRHPEHGGYARGEETRARIIATALQVFGEQDYDHASTRQIAASAGVNPPALQYYFDSKEGLYRACVQAILDRVWEVMAPAMRDAQAAIATRRAAAALEALLALLDALADGLVAAGAETWSRFIARGKADGSGPAMTMTRERISNPLRETICALIGVICREPAHSERTRLRALTIIGQVSMFHANRAGTLAALGWRQFDARGLAEMKAVVRAHTRAALALPAQRRRRPSPASARSPRRRR